MKEFYVYAYLDKERPGKFTYQDLSFDYEPFYIGKGKNDRCYKGIRDKKKSIKVCRIKSMLDKENYPLILKLYTELSNWESFKLEIETIQKIGRINDNTGPLANMTEGGTGGLGLKHTEEWKSILCKPIIQYKDDLVINEFSSVKEAAEKLNLIPQNISSVLNGKYKTTGGFYFKFKNPEDVVQNHTKEKPKMPKHSETTKIKMSQSAKKGEDHPQYKKRGKNSQFAKKVQQLTEDDRLIRVWDSVMDIKRELGFSPSNISRCCHGSVKRIGGFKWKYL